MPVATLMANNFAIDITRIRDEARQHLKQGRVTPSDTTDVERVIDGAQPGDRQRDGVLPALHAECDCRPGHRPRAGLRACSWTTQAKSSGTSNE